MSTPTPSPSATPIDSASLYCTIGSADKEYHVEIVPHGTGYVVETRWGRRGGTLAHGSKTPAPVTLEKAQQLFRQLVTEKTKKGYSPGVTGTPYAETPLAGRVSGLCPQLLTVIEEPQVTALLNDPAWWMQEKKDGHRRMAEKTLDGTVGVNKKGLIVPLPAVVTDVFATLRPRQLQVDGEAIGPVLWLFDCLGYDVHDLRSRPYADRYETLTRILQPCADSAALALVPVFRTTTEKQAAYERFRTTGAEGVVFKRAAAPYTPSRPARGGDQVKFQFRARVTCRVHAHTGKRSVTLSLRTDAHLWIPISNVTIPANHVLPAPGTFVEILYLYAYPGSHALAQPVYLGERDDVDENDCGFGQLKYKSSEGERDDEEVL